MLTILAGKENQIYPTETFAHDYDGSLEAGDNVLCRTPQKPFYVPYTQEVWWREAGYITAGSTTMGCIRRVKLEPGWPVETVFEGPLYQAGVTDGEIVWGACWDAWERKVAISTVVIPKASGVAQYNANANTVYYMDPATLEVTTAATGVQGMSDLTVTPLESGVKWWWGMNFNSAGDQFRIRKIQVYTSSWSLHGSITRGSVSEGHDGLSVAPGGQQMLVRFNEDIEVWPLDADAVDDLIEDVNFDQLGVSDSSGITVDHELNQVITGMVGNDSSDWIGTGGNTGNWFCVAIPYDPATYFTDPTASTAQATGVVILQRQFAADTTNTNAATHGKVDSGVPTGFAIGHNGDVDEEIMGLRNGFLISTGSDHLVGIHDKRGFAAGPLLEMNAYGYVFD